MNRERVLQELEAIKRQSFKTPEASYQQAQSLFLEAEAASDTAIMAQAKFTMALACRSMTRLSDCYDHAYSALELFQNTEDAVGIASALNLIGVVYFYYARYDRALMYFLRALEWMQNAQDPITLSRIYNNLGEVHRETQNFAEALIAYLQALDISEKNGFDANRAVILENVGEIYFRQGAYDASFDCYMRSHAILSQGNDLSALSELEDRIGQIYFVRRDYARARDYFNKALSQLEELNNRYFSIDVLINLAKLESTTSGDRFLMYMERAAQYADAVKARKKSSRIYKLLTEFHETAGDYKAALDNHKHFHLMEQEIEATTITQKLEILMIEINRMKGGERLGILEELNQQLEREIFEQNQALESLEKANNDLSEAVFVDDLTGIPNRRQIKDHLIHIVQDQNGNRKWLALFMIDIDHFKRYNDSLGHLAGDDCLKLISKVMTEAVKPYGGFIGRYGGEEFVCVLEVDQETDVLTIAEELRKAVEAEKRTYLWDGTPNQITISIGGVYGEGSSSMEYHQLFEVADKALYEAKNDGRNQVCLHTLQEKSVSV